MSFDLWVAASRQLGIVQFGPLKPHMLELAQGCQAVLPGLPSMPCSTVSLDREFDAEASSSPPKAPALVPLPLELMPSSCMPGMHLGCLCLCVSGAQTW